MANVDYNKAYELYTEKRCDELAVSFYKSLK